MIDECRCFKALFDRQNRTSKCHNQAETRTQLIALEILGMAKPRPPPFRVRTRLIVLASEFNISILCKMIPNP